MTTVKERPILFSGPMIRAILEGRKTHTRRIVKPQPPEGESITCEFYHPLRIDRKGIEYPGEMQFGAWSEGWDAKYPYGQPGDRLWVRENGWQRPNDISQRLMREGADTWAPYYYDADLSPADHEQFKLWRFKRRPSIHMPRWASRITLDIAGVRVERLQDISEADAIAEGVDQFKDGDVYYPPGNGDLCVQFPITAYRCLWEYINGPGSWDANPWVWVIEFKPINPAQGDAQQAKETETSK